MSITLTNFVRGNNLASADFNFDDPNNQILVKTGAGSSVKAAIDAAVAALPADKFVDGISAYNATTNVLTLSLSDGSTVDLDMTNLIADAVASVAVTPDATETVKGIAEIATQTETNTGTDDTRFVTPLKLATFVANAIASATAPAATETVAGIVELATTAEATTGTDTARAVTPAGVKAAITAALSAQLDVFNL